MHKWTTKTTPDDAKPTQKTMYDKSINVKTYIIENEMNKAILKMPYY